MSSLRPPAACPSRSCGLLSSAPAAQGRSHVPGAAAACMHACGLLYHRLNAGALFAVGAEQLVYARRWR